MPISLPIPYIGITDFATSEQVEKMLAVFNNNLAPGQNRRLHVGVMTSYERLNSIETTWSNVFPHPSLIPDIFSSDEVMNCLHYADYSYARDLFNSLFRAIKCCGPNINAVQLDMCWPNPDYVRKAITDAKEKLGIHLDVILQIDDKALSQVEHNPKKVVKRLQKYSEMIQYVLLDQRGGKEKGLDSRWLTPFVQEIRDSHSQLGVAVAGGLGPKTLELLEPLIAEFPDLSIDAQSQLRKSGSAKDPIDWDLAEEYLIQALSLKAFNLR